MAHYFPHTRCLILALISAISLSAEFRHAHAADKLPPDHAKQMAAGLELFKTHVRGVLKQQCIKCHGGEKTNGELDLTTRDGLIKGGSQGPAVVPGKASESLLLHLIRHEAEPTMPEEGDKLPDDMLRHFGDWIDAGAPYDGPLNGADSFINKKIPPERRGFWSFQPLKDQSPPSVHGTAWCRTPIDRFVLSQLETKNLHPRAAADRRKLIRRASFDLLGLPPTPDEVQAFLNDTSPDAYERLIDRLLASPHYGERWGRHWLDLARFAESHGYEQDYDRPTAYHYRDFVIKALNDDMAYDRFVKLQLAGDELEPNNPLAMMATGFLGAGVHATQITASQVEKERYDELDDITGTIGTSMLGLTVSCARCHDHKFDPIPQADYYRMLATFTTTVRSEIDLDLDPDGYKQAKAAFDQEHAPLIRALAEYERTQLPRKLDEWLKQPANIRITDATWLVIQPNESFTQSKAELQKNADGSLSVSGPNPNFDIYDLKFDSPLDKITAVRVEALPDSALPQGGPGRAGNGNFALSELRISAAPRDSKDKGKAFPFADAEATFEQRGFSVAGTLDDTSTTAWAVDGNIGQRSAAVFRLEKPIAFKQGAKFTISFNFANNVNHGLGRFRVSISAASDMLSADADSSMHDAVMAAKQTLDKPRNAWTSTDRKNLERWYATTVDTEWKKLNAAVEGHSAHAPKPKRTKVLVTSEGLPPLRLHTQGADFFEHTYFLKRGDLTQKQGIAPAGYLQVLMPQDGEETRWHADPPSGCKSSYRRASMAKWITDVDHGAGALLARVIVNRLWQHHFGRGIVSTPSDFGAQGERPTHPELLDHLALQLVREGWHLKQLHKLMMTSAAYMQSADFDPACAAIDPDNKLLWRRDRIRLEGEAIRDSMLAVSGTLDRRMFGPGSLDEGQARRSIYFTIKRSHLIPLMTLFDGPDSLQGLGKRASTTVAPQALALLNNPQVRRYAQSFAEKLAAHAQSCDEQVTRGYQLALGRPPERDELAQSIEFISGQQQAYASSEKKDANLLALADFCQALFSLNEFVFVE